MTETVLDIGEVDIASSLTAFRMLPRDPTVTLGPGAFARATTTPDGPGQISATWAAGGTEVTVRTYGDGADWLQRQAPAMLGLHDDVAGFDPDAAPLRNLWRLHRGNRVTASGTLWHDLAWFIVQQRVTRQEAADSWAQLVRGLGAPAPGPGELLVPPTPAAVGRLTYDRLHPFGLERRRAEHLIAAARCTHRLLSAPDADTAQLTAALAAVPGIGPWTLSCLRTFTWGSADTVITGDSGIPSLITWLLAGERRGTDERMLELLEPYRPHRYRVIRLAFASGVKPPRHGPHAPVRSIRRM